MLISNLKVAIVGTGFIVPIHIEAKWNRSPSIVDKDKKSADNKAREWRVPRA